MVPNGSSFTYYTLNGKTLLLAGYNRSHMYISVHGTTTKKIYKVMHSKKSKNKLRWKIFM